MIKPTLEEVKKLSRDHTIVPIALEIFSDQKTPIEILRNIRRQSDCWFILESVSSSDSWGRYSFLGYKPVLTIYGTGDSVIMKNGIHVSEKIGDPIAIIRDVISKYSSPRVPFLPPFTGGFVGYFAYDFVRHIIPGLAFHTEKSRSFGMTSDRTSDNETFRDFHLMLIDKLIVFDHFKQKIYIIVNIPANRMAESSVDGVARSKSIEENYIDGVTQLKDIERMILTPAADSDEEPSLCGEFSSAFTIDEFGGMVEKVKHHIAEGDISQAVVSNRFKAPFSGSLMNTYRILRTTNPSAYMVYLRLDDMEIACSSPETLIALRDGVLSSFPIAGTCPRGRNAEEDAALIESLLKDEKELAEHDMLVDLARNDIGKISRFGSVKVHEYRQIRRLSHVNHIFSQVNGKLCEGMDALDVISAAMPAGTLSGAPKKRACEIIDSVEGLKRGIYGGAIGYIDFAGNMDMCIGIRMAVLKNDNVYVQAGAGIVADSVPEKEYKESLNKAAAVLEALKTAGRSEKWY